MTTTHIGCIIPAQTTNGDFEIPASAWVELTRELRENFDAELYVYDRSCPAYDHERPPHYIVDVRLLGAFGPQARLPIVRFIEPRIKRIVEQYSTPHMPLAR